jgi:hypothetical protein
MPKRRTGKGSRANDIHWKNMDSEIIRVMDHLKEFGFSEPTVRAVYYVLGSENKLPLTNTGYKSLDAKIVQMRKDGVIPWGFFAIKRGRSYEAVPYFSPKDWADASIKELKEASKDYQFPRWLGQKNYVEVWIEKDGLLGALRSWLAESDVTVRAPQGYGAWEFIKSATDDIHRILKQRPDIKKVTIFYLGDLDPSGKDIPRFMHEDALDHFGLECDFIELALDPDQVQEYELPPLPESPEVLEKIRRDVRLKGYLAEYGEVFCELDAFFALHTQEARDLIVSRVEALFDQRTYQETLPELAAAKRKVQRIVRKFVKFKRVKKPKKRTRKRRSRR